MMTASGRLRMGFPLQAGLLTHIKQGMLDWANQYSILLFLDSNQYPDASGRYECLLGAGARYIISPNAGDPLDALQQQHRHDWLMGHLSYDLKNSLEPRLSSRHPARHLSTETPLSFFCPEVVCYILRGSHELIIESAGPDPLTIFEAIKAAAARPRQYTALPELQFTNRFSRADYIEVIQRLRAHIREGDCYEINFCTEAFCTDAFLDDPQAAFTALQRLSPAPFAAFYRQQHFSMMSASPERYLCKSGNRIIAQPIKGTARRHLQDPVADEQSRQQLLGSIKERAEHVMIVDLLRNDLARCCTPGSISVDELYGLYRFPQVHQMISTVSGLLEAERPFTDALRYSFPMGSMTGAPKFRVMELIEQYERSRRELFSGSVGYISPEGDFDFNVVIRSLFYNSQSRYLSYQTGGAITWDSQPEQEYEEMRLKAWALERIFSHDLTP